MWSGNRESAAAQAHRAVMAEPEAAPLAEPAQEAKSQSVLRREAMLGRDQKVAGYTFMLRHAPDGQRDPDLPDVQRLRDETLLGNLQRLDIARLLGQRLAFVPISAAMLNHALIEDWPAGMVWLLKFDAQTQADDPLRARLAELRTRGFAFALQVDAVLHPDRHALLQYADYVWMDVSGEDIPAITAQMAALSKLATGKRFVATGVQTLEAFHMCHKLQFAFFMGPFITRRENLDCKVVGPSRAKVLDLMNRVRTGAERPNWRRSSASIRCCRCGCYATSIRPAWG